MRALLALMGRSDRVGRAISVPELSCKGSSLNVGDSPRLMVAQPMRWQIALKWPQSPRVPALPGGYPSLSAGFVRSIGRS